MNRPPNHPETEKKSIASLDEKDFIDLYNLGQTMRLKNGEALFREEEEDDRFFLVMKGAFEARKSIEGRPLNGFKYFENDWIGETLFFPKPRKISTVVAIEPSTALAFDQKAFSSLDPRIQVFALKKMNDLSATRIDELRRRHLRAVEIADYYRTYIHESLQEAAKHYEQSDMLFAIIKSVPRLPVYTTRLVGMLLGENASAKEVKDLAKEDPSLVSEILKTINSSYYNLKRKVSDLQYAIMYLGFFQVYQIVISDGLRKVMPNTPEFMGIHHHSVITSHLAFEICQLSDKRSSSIMSTIALLHDIGKSVILLIRAKNPKLAFFVEMLDSPTIGAMLLREWNIPDSVCETVRCQHYPRYRPPSDLPPEHRRNIAYLYLAHACHEYFQGEVNAFLKHPFINDYIMLLNVSGHTIEGFIEKYLIPNLKLKIHTFPQHVQSFLSKKIEINLPR